MEDVKVTIKEKVWRSVGIGFMILAVIAAMQLSGCEPLADSEVRTTTLPGVTGPGAIRPIHEAPRVYIDPNDYKGREPYKRPELFKKSDNAAKKPSLWTWERSRILGLPVLDPDFNPELPDFKVIDIEKKPAYNPARYTEYDYYVRYELPNGKTCAVIITRDLLTDELVREAIREDLRYELWLHRKTH